MVDALAAAVEPDGAVKPMTWLPWLLFPLIGASIGYATNWLAIRMLFRPRQRRWGMQGLLPRRRHELARRIGQVVARDLVRIDEMLEPIKDVDLEPTFTAFVDDIVASKSDELRQMPLIGALFSPQMFSGIRDRVVRELVGRQGEIIDRLGQLAGEHIDIAALAETKVAGFELDGLERVVNEVAHRELRAIEIWGAVLGAVVGLAQAALLALLPLGHI